MTGLGRDLYFALRVFKRTPLFSVVATVVLAIAMLLTMLGLYASMQHMVEARRTASVLAAGCTGALMVALLAGERLGELLFGLDALSPVAWGAAIGVVLATGLGAAWLPAVRAGRVDPAVALRYE